ncbi:hypothetical protein GGR53DRAFT_324147 [Hypoxylon sp. FL1150]|nr:hypothetical protein GGR53DRAFT_324147 [Hypoxylon sp. FL1150]
MSMAIACRTALRRVAVLVGIIIQVYTTRPSQALGRSIFSFPPPFPFLPDNFLSFSCWGIREGAFKMEALVAVGLASNVLQFVDFATKLVSKAGELQKDLASSDHKDYDAIAAHLQTLAEKVKDSARSVAQSSATVSPEEKALQPLADGCCELANKLSRRLYRLGLSSAQSGSILRRGKAAWRWVWNKKETEEIVERLHYFGSQLAFHMTYQIKQNQLGQASKDDTQAVLRRTNEVLLSIEGLRLSIHEKLDKQHKDVLESIANVEAVNRQLQAQTTHEMSLASQATSKGIHDLGTSLSTLMLKQNEDMRASKSEILESLATIRVENSELHSRATQVLPYTRDFDSASLRHLLGSMLDEYNENIILGIRKEFRSTALRDMESMRTQALHALDGMQPETKTRVSMAQSAPEPAAEPSSPESSMLTQATIDTEGDALKSRDNIRQKKKNITLVYAYYQLIETRIGTLSFIIRDRVVFDPVKPPVSVYELTAHFTPSPQWCSKGLLVTYEKVTDARGTPRLGFQLEPYRILDNEHKVWEVIYEHDIDSLRCMLAERVISPNDRDSDGKTLLMEAIQCGRLDLVKALVHSGADINATDW